MSIFIYMIFTYVYFTSVKFIYVQLIYVNKSIKKIPQGGGPHGNTHNTIYDAASMDGRDGT